MSQERKFPCEPRGDVLSWLVPELKRQGYDNPRIEVRDGRLYFGSAPWADCDWCGSVRDTAEFDCCPFCWCDTERRDRERWAQIAAEELDRRFPNLKKQ
jgi:hypothetical protein